MDITRIRKTTPEPKHLTIKARVVYRDPAGNRLYCRRKANGVVQWSAKNRSNRLVNYEGTRKLMREYSRNR